ncbi:MAG: hypothetical protein AB7I19_04675 [Planctomycetota bacterium]
MDSERFPDSRDQANTASREYRTKLLTKLNCLIAVLDVALAKVGRSMEEPGANSERLTRIRTNLENTLAICHRARRTLQRAMEGGAVENSAEAARRRMSYRDYVELTSIEEYRKFKTLPPISAEELTTTDLDDLLRRLSGS